MYLYTIDPPLEPIHQKLHVAHLTKGVDYKDKTLQ